MITGLDIVCLSTQDWTDLWTRKQRFMRAFARQGNRVLYVELQASLASAALIRRDPGRIGRWLRGPRLVEPNLHVATLPLVIPGFQMSLAVNRTNNFALAPLLRRWLEHLDMATPVVWTYTPYSESLVDRLGARAVVYDCVDEFTASRGLVRAPVVAELERRLLDRVDVTVVTHENLLRSKARPGRPIYLVPNAAEVELFARASSADLPVAAEIAALPHPVVGFLGSIQYWIDMELLQYLATSRPDWSFALIGPVGRLANIALIDHLPNVHVLGPRPYEALPSYLAGFDVCLNPYRQDEVAAHCSPLKLYEYLATGKPVVSVDMPAARAFDGVIAIGRDYADVLTRLDEALAVRGSDTERTAARIAAAAPHTWTNRFRALEHALEPHLMSAAARPRR